MNYIEQYRRDRLQKGFTFIELIFVMAIMGLLAAVAIPGYRAVMRGARKRKAESTITVLKTSITQYQIDTNSHPRTLKDLIIRPTDERITKKWNGPYLESELPDEDPWGNPYVYRVTPGAKNPYELYSLGPNAEEGSKEDRIGQWN